MLAVFPKLMPHRESSVTAVGPMPHAYRSNIFGSNYTDITLSGELDPPRPQTSSLPSSTAALVPTDSSSTTSSTREYVYALKSIHLDKCANAQLRKELLNEITILREIDHANIARAIETFDWNSRLFICLELCSGGDLYSRDPYTEREAAEIVTDILSAVAYLHSKGIIHRDLKLYVYIHGDVCPIAATRAHVLRQRLVSIRCSENIMFVDTRPDAECKIIDFGLSQKFASQDESMSDAVGTVYTMAPELLAGNYTSKADVWSVGVITYMLLSSSMPFFGSTRYQVMKQICKGKIKFTSKRWKKVSKYAKGMVLHMLEADPQQRPSADRALRYSKHWIRHLDEQQQQEQSQLPSDAAATPNQSLSAAPTQQPNISLEQGQSRWSPSKSPREGGDIDMMDRIQASIQAFAQYNTLKKLALMVIAYKSSASEIGWLRSTFNKFDSLQNGEISLEEFTQALSNVYEYTIEEMEALFMGMDIDGTGLVHYTEFLAATIEAHGAIAEDRIAEAFDRIDSDDTGYITMENRK
jgi:calcium-dependent protein kinase